MDVLERDTKRFLTASFRPRIKARPSGRSGDGQCATVFRKKLTRCDILVAGHTCSRKAGPSPIDRARLMLYTYDNSQNHHFVISHKHTFRIWIIFHMEAFLIFERFFFRMYGISSITFRSYFWHFYFMLRVIE